MSEWIIKRNGQGGQTVEDVCQCNSLEYHGEWMGDEYVLVDVKSAVPVDFHLNDYLEYRGENYYLSYDPNVVKKARRGSYGEGFNYDNIKLYAIGRKLKTIDFKDVVLHGEDHKKLAYTSLSEFSFFAGSVEDLADRLQANLSRDSEGWNVLTPNWTNCKARGITQSLWEEYYNDPSTYGTWNDGTDGVTLGETDVNITVASDQRCSDVLKFAYEQFGLAYYIKGTDIVIGGVPIRETHLFRYGKGNGLYEIERTSEEDQELLTKVWGYGSDKNLPLNYYANLHKEVKFTISHKSVKTDIVNHPTLSLWVDTEWTKQLNDAFSPNFEVTLVHNQYSARFRVTGSDTIFSDTEPRIDFSTPHLHFYWIMYGEQDVQTFFNNVNVGDDVYAIGADINQMPSQFVVIPSGYYYPSLLSINKLMLPGFPDMSLNDWLSGVAGGSITGGDAGGLSAVDAADLLTKYDFSDEKYDPWVQSKNAAVIGTLEGVVNFDGSGQTEIYPTIENTSSGVVLSADTIRDNGYLSEGADFKFHIFVNRGSGYLDWKDALYNAVDRNGVYIEMTSDYCVGRKFKVQDASEGIISQTDVWVLTCEREKDSSLERYFPYFDNDESEYCQVRQNDTFVVTGIQMPDLYIRYASVKLLIAVCGWLDKRDHVRYTYVPKIDEIWMARQHDEADAGTSLHDTLKAGMQFQFEDAADLGIERYEGNGHTAPYIDNITIKEDGNNGVPTYDVVLRDEKEKGVLDKLADNVSQLMGATDPTERNERVVEYVEYGAWSPLVDYYYETLNVAENRLETSRVWHWGIIWECRRSFTKEEPCYGCQDWTEVGGDIIFRIFIYDENNIDVGSSLLVQKGKLNETVKGMVFRGQEDVSDKVSAWSWDFVDTDDTVADTRQITLTDAMLPESWNVLENVTIRCNATIAQEHLSTTLKIVNYDTSNYEIEFTGYVDVITVDDVGNVIGGLYTVSGDYGEHRSYRIHSAISVRKNSVPLLYTAPTGTSVEGDDERATSGHYKIYGEGHGCSFVIEDSTLYITGIDNIKDGVPGTPDDVDFDYDAMRLMESCSVDLVVDCEGKASIVKNFPVTIKHDSQPFVAADLSNQMSSVSWNTKTQTYIGLPITTDVSMWHNNEALDIEDVDDVSITSATTGVSLVNGSAINVDPDTIYYSKSIVTEEGHKHAHISFDAMGKDLPATICIDITAVASYAGVRYERTLRHTINKATDVNIYSLVPYPNDVAVTDGVLSADEVSCKVWCDSSDDKHYEVSLDANGKNTTHKLMLCWQRDTDSQESAYTEAVSITASVKHVTFRLYGLDGLGNKDANTLHDTEDVPVLTAGRDGVSVSSFLEVQEAWGDSPSTPPQSGWSESTPTKNAKYLWRRSRKMVLNTEHTAYTPAPSPDGDWKYQRLDGTDGTSINTRGQVSDATKRGGTGGSSTTLDDGEAELTTGTVVTMENGDAVVQQDNRHLYQWVTEGGGQWIDLGEFKGEDGVTYYTHIAWAETVENIIAGGIDPTAEGQISRPNVASVNDVTGGSISPATDGSKPWMGLLINIDADADDVNWHYYTWNYSKGASGDNSVHCDLDNEHEDFLYDDEETLIAPANGMSTQARLYDGEAEVTSQATWRISDDNGYTWGVRTDTNAIADISSAGVLVVTGLVASSAKVMVRAEYPASSGKYYYSTFTGNKTRQDKYDLIVLPNAISYNVSSYTPQTITLSAKRTDFQGNQSNAAISTNVGSGPLRLFRANVNPGGTMTTPQQQTATTYTVSGTSASTYAGIYFELRKYNDPSGDNSSSYHIVDYETVAISKSVDAISYEVEIAIASIAVEYGSSASLSTSVRFYNKLGSAARQQLSGYYAAYKRTGASYELVSNGYGIGFTLATSVAYSVDGVVVYLFQSAYSGTTPEGQAYLAKKEVVVNRVGKSAVQYWLRASTLQVNVIDDNTPAQTSPDTLTVDLMKTDGDVTTALTSIPQGLADGMSIELWFDGVYSMAYSDNIDPDAFYDDFGQGMPTAAFANFNALELRLRARTKTTVYDSVTIVSVRPTTTWKLESDVMHFRFSRDYAGVLTGTPADTTIRAIKSRGDIQTVYDGSSSLPNGIRLGWIAPNKTWLTAPNLGVNTATVLMTNGSTFYDSTSIGLYEGGTVQSDYTITGGKLLGMLTITAEIVPQRMLVPAGEFVKNAHQTKYYYLTERTCPLVLYNGEYWYLVAESASTNCVEDQTNEPRTNNVSKWQKAEEYEVILTKMLFASFAKLGSFVVYGDYFYSQYGTLFINDNGTVQEIAVNASNYATDYTTGDGTTSVPYGFFSYSDPMPTADSTPEDEGRFRPALCLNAKTGESWFAQGKVHMDALGNVSVEGVVKATNMFKPVALSWGDFNIRMLDVNGGTRLFFYVRALNRTDSQRLADKYGFVIGDYVEYNEQMQADEDDTAAVEDGMNNSTFTDNDFVPCSYNADIVLLLDKLDSNVYYPDGGKVYLPEPSAFPGKMVEVRHTSISPINNPAIATTVTPDVVSFVLHPELDPTQGLISIVGNNRADSVTINPRTTVSFYSIGTYWLVCGSINNNSN